MTTTGRRRSIDSATWPSSICLHWVKDGHDEAFVSCSSSSWRATKPAGWQRNGECGQEARQAHDAAKQRKDQGVAVATCHGHRSGGWRPVRNDKPTTLSCRGQATIFMIEEMAPSALFFGASCAGKLRRGRCERVVVSSNFAASQRERGCSKKRDVRRSRASLTRLAT